MIRALLIFVATLPGVASAQDVVVRSGEHGDFTRLVFDIPPSAVWELAREPGKRAARLSFIKTGIEFDLSRAFEKIARDRVSDLVRVEGQSALDIVLDCECDAQAFVLRERMLVVDIKEKENPETPAVVVENSQTIKPEKHAADPAADNSVTTELTNLWLGLAARIGPPKQNTVIPLGVPLQRSAIDVESPALDSADAGTVRNQIFNDVAGAASQGLLDHSRNFAAAPPRKTQIAENQDAPAGEGYDPQTEAILEEVVLKKGRISIGGQDCVPDPKLNIAKWVDADSDINMALSARRGAVFGEFDRINQNAVRTLAKSTLYFGFGAETRTVLQLQDRGPDPVLSALSYLVDGDKDPSAYFAQQLACEGQSSLWAAIDGSQMTSSSDLNTPAILRSFELLPKHLREHLGPILADNFTQAGFTEIAKDVLRRLERTSGEETDSIKLGKAHIDMMEGNEEDAAEALKELTVSQSLETAKAVVATVEIARSTGDQVSERIVDLSAAYSAELRDTEQGPELWQAHVTSLIVNERFEEALEVLNDVDGVSENLVVKAKNEAFAAIFQKADDVAFLKFFFHKLPKPQSELEDKNMLMAAKRVLSLGLPKAALETLEKITNPELVSDVRMLKAQALIDLSRPEEAEILLIGLTGDNVARLRAKARSLMGDHDFAQTIYAELGEEDQEVTEAWLSGDWNSIADQESPLAPAAQLFAEAPFELAEGGVSLQEAETLFGSSADARKAISEMLQATQFE